MQKTHDLVTDREGVFDKAIAMFTEGKRRGYQVCTNTTVFRETELEEIEELFAYLQGIGVDGMLISPGYHYETLEANHFLFRDEIHQKFKRVLALSKKYRLYSTPLFLQFAAGQREYPCTPWGNPTFTPKGWKGPCYLIEDNHFPSWKEFWKGRGLGLWETRQDPRCQNCLMHSGFEAPSSVSCTKARRDMLTMAKWNYLS